MNQITKIAIVGLGRIGWRFHFQQALSSDQFELTAVVDPLPERLSEARAAAGCETHTDFESLWSGPLPDVVAIATPTTLHEDMTIPRPQRRLSRHPRKTHDHLPRLGRSHDRPGRKKQPPHLSLSTPPPHTRNANRARNYPKRHARTYLRHTPGRISLCAPKRLAELAEKRRRHAQQLRCALPRPTHLSLGRLGNHRSRLQTLGNSHPRRRRRRGQSLGKKESGQLLDVQINQASAYTMPLWHICGKYGTAIREDNVFKVRYYDPAEAPPLNVIEGAAPERSYDNKDRLPWREEDIPITRTNSATSTPTSTT